MPYVTTKLHPLKSYPTYQFYARADSKRLSVDDVFKICILENFKWLRSRLKDFPDIPESILTIEPENFAELPDNALSSFSYTNGLSLDVVYIEKKGIWSFWLSESDMGANLGTSCERLPVQGRTFNTEFTFRKQMAYVEIGVRTICSEPSDTTADCEVFRPTVVKALAENSDLRIQHGGFILDKKPLEVRSRNDLERLFSLLDDDELNLPIVLVADSKTETKIPEIPKIEPALSFNTSSFSMNNNFSVSIDPDKLNLKGSFPVAQDKAKKSKEKTAAIKPVPVTTKLPVFDYNELARVLVGFAIVVFAEERFFTQIGSRIRIKLDFGDIAVISHHTETEHHKYNEYADDMGGMFRSLRKEMISMPKRKQYNFGEILFHSDAKLQEYHTRRHETTSLEEQCSIYRLENAELKNQIREQSQLQTDMQQIAEKLRLTQKKLDAALNESESYKNLYNNLLEKNKAKEDAYKNSTDLIAFYKEQVRQAASFPIYKDDVCDWIEDRFSEDILLSSRARSEMRKYSGALDVASLCDAMVYLKAYSQYRKNEIPEETLKLYAERNNWEVQSSGKETLKMRRSDYTATYNGEQYLLDLHIKHGVKSEELIRIYFCWLEDEGRLLIGSMPGHLATAKQNT